MSDPYADGNGSQNRPPYADGKGEFWPEVGRRSIAAIKSYDLCFDHVKVGNKGEHFTVTLRDFFCGNRAYDCLPRF
jgi:hypothetical protein